MSTEERKIEAFADTLRAQILQGDFGTRGRIPTVDELARTWKTSRSTVYYVLQLLQSEGVIRRSGKSLIASYPALEIEGITENFERFLKAQGFETTMENLIDPSLETMPLEIASLFGQPKGVKVVHRMRLQGINGQLLRIAENFYPAELAGEFVEQMRTNQHMDVLGAIKKTHGVYITQAQDVVIARVPTANEAKLLELVRTEPIVEIRRSNFAEDGRPVMFNRIIHVAPHFKFTYNYPVNHWK